MHTPEQIQTSKDAITRGFFRREIRDAKMTAEVVEPAKEAVLDYARTQADPVGFLLTIAKDLMAGHEAEIIDLMLTASKQHATGYAEEAFMTSEGLVDTAVQLRDEYDAAATDGAAWAAE